MPINQWVIVVRHKDGSIITVLGPFDTFDAAELYTEERLEGHRCSIIPLQRPGR